MELYNLTLEEEDQLVEAQFQDLLKGYLASNHRKKVEIIERAFRFAKEAHKGIRRRSGEPYIIHPIAVAQIVSQEIGLGSTSICAALLHDVVEDTEYTVEDIESQFGKKIAQIVAGLTKISGGIFGDKASEQSENFRKLLVSMAEDIRVILIKMSDRLHNMRTLGSMLPSKQYKIAGETLYIYAPLAHRLGLFAIKTELEDLSFKYEHPEVYKTISEQIASTESRRSQIYEEYAIPVRMRLDKMGLKYDMTARVKSVYSIWSKMETKHIPFEEVYDLYAVRIVFECDNEADEKRICWTIYSEITDLYRLHPDRTRDWVSTPKANGYKALHLTVMGPDGNWIEVQIRSKRMDETAEKGLAAHWKYKVGEGIEESNVTNLLETIKETLKDPEPNSIDFIGTLKLNLFASEIIIFTPKGELITLPKDASVLDVAFNLHSQLGTHCIAGKVNHKLVPLSHKLHSGDQVEVLTSHSQRPQEEWANFLVSAKGEAGLRTALRKERRRIMDLGEKKFNDMLMAHDIASLDNDLLTKILGAKRVQNRDELFFMLGNNEITISEQFLKTIIKPNDGIISKLLRNPFGTSKSKVTETTKSKNTETPKPAEKAINRKETYTLKVVDGKSNYSIAECCHPIPGDDVLGYIEDNDTVMVHKLTCPTAMRLKSSYGGRLLSTKWENNTEKFIVNITIEGIDRQGILQEIIQIISTSLSINIRKLNIESENGVFKSHLIVLVEDTKVVKQLCKKLKKINGVQVATRD